MQSREIASNAMQSQRDSQKSTAMQCNFSEIVRAMQSQCNPKTRLLADSVWSVWYSMVKMTKITKSMVSRSHTPASFRSKSNS